MPVEQHISKSFDKDLQDVQALFLKMGKLAAKQVADAIHSWLDGNDEVAIAVIETDKTINEIERQIDERLLLLLAKRQPVAGDLRFILAMSKGVTDIERIGDEAVKIAQMAQQIISDGGLAGGLSAGYSEIQHLSNQARLMVHNALEAFSYFYADIAFDVMQSDEAINREYQTAMRSLMTYVMEDSRSVSQIINIMWVLRALERIGDHARNIAELVIYAQSGQDVRHIDFKEVAKVVQDS